MKRIFDAKIWKTGNSYVVTIPLNVIKRFKLKDDELVEIVIKKIENE